MIHSFCVVDSGPLLQRIKFKVCRRLIGAVMKRLIAAFEKPIRGVAKLLIGREPTPFNESLMPKSEIGE